MQKRRKGGLAQMLQRRDVLKALSAAGVGVAMMPMLPRQAAAEEQGIYFTWAGYDDPNLFPSYVEKNGELPDMPVFADAQEALIKMQSGFIVDVAHPCSGEVPRFRDTGMIQPLDTSRLTNWNDMVPALRDLEAGMAEGKHWFAPVDWGQTSVTYRTDLVELDGEESWGILFDERYAGKVAMIGSAEDSWFCAAIYAGVDIHNITEADVKTVGDILRAQRPLVRMYSSDLTSVEQALASGELVAAMTWNDSAANLVGEGHPVKFADPKEGALTWCCGLVIGADAPHLDKAYDIINSITSPEVGSYFISDFWYGHSNARAFDGFTDEEIAAIGLSKDPTEVLARGHFYTPPDPAILSMILTDWEEIIAGF